MTALLSDVIVTHQYPSYVGPTTIGLVVLIVLVGLALYFVPGLDATLKKILIAIVVVCFIVWLIGVIFWALARFTGWSPF